MGVDLTQLQAQQLDAFAGLVEKWNKGMNLVSRQDIQRLVPRHLLDSLAAAPFVHGQSLLDVGTGPGLPGLPLAIANPEVSVTLWERMSRRVRFLQLACRELGLDNVHIQERDLYQREPGQVPEQFDVIVARAVAPIATLWPAMRGCLNAQGRLIVYSHVADADERRAVPAEIEGLVEYSYQVPGLENEHFLQILPNPTNPIPQAQSKEDKVVASCPM